MEAKEEGYDIGAGVPEFSFNYNESMHRLFDLYINNSVTERGLLGSKSVADSMAEFALGQCAMIQNGNWAWSQISGVSGNVVKPENIKFMPIYTGVEGEEKAGLNCGTENYWAINSKVSEADQKATMDFMVWCVTNEEASRKLVDTFGVMPYKSAAESTNGFLAAANKYSADGCYVMDWATNYQPNVDEYRKALVSALNAYNANQTEANWAKVKTAFVDGWAYQYKQINK
jgi:raffinose/stachyose/melibiose transport system substrate-binding protein